jgi:hypothetical protein
LETKAMKTIALIGVLGAALTLTACEQYYGPPAPVAAYAAPAYGVPTAAVVPACFRSRDIRNHTIADDHTAFINVGGRAVYRIQTSGSCFAGATSSDPIVMRQPPGSAYICKPIDMDLSVSLGGGIPTHCIVNSITPMTPAEIASLPPKLRP